MRSAITLTALIARGHWDEFAMHVRAARRNGLTVEEIREVLLQAAVYIAVPSANHGFAVAEQELARYEQPEGETTTETAPATDTDHHDANDSGRARGPDAGDR